MKEDFFKFPSTPHLAALNGIDIRVDKVMSEAKRNDFLRHELIVEEKVDGANLGISFDFDGNILAQNRGAYLPLLSSGQWEKLSDWLSIKVDILFEQLTDRYILFGEWCYAQHSVYYDRLPDWFIGFDIYDKKIEQYLSRSRCVELFGASEIYPVPIIEKGYFTLSNLIELLTKSKFGPEPAEGLYLRFDHNDWLVQRAKLVHPEFIQSVNQHWSRTYIRTNRLLSKC